MSLIVHIDRIHHIDLTTQVGKTIYVGINMHLELDENSYCLEAVQKSAYRFIDKLTILISTRDDTINCDIEMNDGSEINQKILNAFKRELLDQQLRLSIKKETEPQRNLILAYAFSKTGLQE